MPGKKILLVQLYSNGDCLYVTAIARQIKQDFPGSHLVWAIASFCKEILTGNPYVDEIMEVTGIAKNDARAFRRFKKKVLQQKAAGTYEEVFITQALDSNQCYYDGTIRGNLFRTYPFPITVPVTPVLRLTQKEMDNAQAFALQHKLSQYDQVLLFEFAPQSGQLQITKEFVIGIAEGIVQKGRRAVVLSSGTPITHRDEKIIDGSKLSLRETAALTHHCTHLLGCSSGITWISTSEAAKPLNMVQLVDAQAKWQNAVSRDFERFHLRVESVIDLVQFDKTTVIDCIDDAMIDFTTARKKHNQPVPLQFRTTRRIVYNLLCYLQLGAIGRHIRVNREVYGHNLSFYAAVIAGFLTFPFKLIRNLVIKRIKAAK